MELIASKLENDTDFPVVDHLYEKCNAVIDTLRNSQPNPHISVSQRKKYVKHRILNS